MRLIGESPELTEPLWRYFKTDRLIEFLRTGELYFSSARQFKDKFEGAVSVLPSSFQGDIRNEKPNHFEKAFEELRRLTKVSCWHRASHESDAMWQLYANKWQGVAIQTNFDKIKKSIQPFKLAPKYQAEDLWAGNVMYVDLIKERLEVSMTERFWYKHMPFEWEHEFRLAISLRMAEEYGVSVPEHGIKVKFDVENLIKHIHLGSFLSDVDVESVRAVAFEHGLGDRIEASSLKGTPKYT